jgi:hypothetical protein
MQSRAYTFSLNWTCEFSGRRTAVVTNLWGLKLFIFFQSVWRNIEMLPKKIVGKKMSLVVVISSQVASMIFAQLARDVIKAIDNLWSRLRTGTAIHFVGIQTISNAFTAHSVADTYLKSGAFLTPGTGSGIRNRFIPDPGSRNSNPYFWELSDKFLIKKFYNSFKNWH